MPVGVILSHPQDVHRAPRRSDPFHPMVRIAITVLDMVVDMCRLGFLVGSWRGSWLGIPWGNLGIRSPHSCCVSSYPLVMADIAIEHDHL